MSTPLTPLTAFTPACRRAAASLIYLAASLVLLGAQAPPAPDPWSALAFRYVGPQGNRTVAVAGVPGDPNVLYAGAASGGIFKTTDGGVHWTPIFDGESVASIGALAVAPSDPNVVWAGTGEAFIRGNISIGNGAYRSTDAGRTWSHTGLDATGRIARVVIHPTNPDIVYVAAMGHCYGPQPERGLFRTMDGGKTWERVLFVDENTGAIDIVMDPSNPRILFAATWQLIIRPWGRESGGPGSGLHMSRDGGTTWQRLTGRGLPDSPLGRIGLAIAPSNANRVYALIETAAGKGVLWRSDNRGENWTLVSRDATLNRRPHYYSRMAVLPDNPNEVYFLTQLELTTSIDGGATSRPVREVWPDNHDMWIDPRNPNRLVVANDRYVNISTNRGASWMRAALPIAQLYHVATDNRIPYYVFGNRQDGPAHRGPSNSLNGTQILPGDWTWTGGSESGFTYADPADPNMVWTSGQAGFLQHFDLRTGLARDVNPWPDRGWPIADLKYRMQWTFPVAISPHDPRRVYVGSQHVHQSMDQGQTWTVISPDLTTNDKTKQQSSGGLTPDNTSVEFYCVLFAIAESPREKGVIWAGSNDGLVHVTRDGGTNWTNVTKNIPGLPPWGTVTNIEPSRHDAGTAYITVDLHQVNDRTPYVYKTADYGATWKSLGATIPRSVFSYAKCVREDPVRRGLLYLGTENGLYVSFDDGGQWMPLQSTLPHAPVSWVTVQEHFNDLVVATYGRGIWILDDITPLQQLDDKVRSAKVHLFAPRAAYRFLTRPVLPMYMGEENDPPSTVGHNPPYGASINYYLDPAWSGRVSIEIRDPDGRLIRTLKGTESAGINRVWWDLRHESTRRPTLRTSPLGRSDIGVGPDGTRAFPVGGTFAPLVQPGTYSVTLKAGGAELSQPLVVRKDPNSLGSEEGIRAQTRIVLDVRDRLNAFTDLIDEIEITRSQLSDIRASLLRTPRWKALVARVDDLDSKLVAIEGEFFDPRITSAGDSFYYPPGLLSKLQGLAGAIAGSDFQPTGAQLEVYGMYSELWSTVRRRFDQLLKDDLPAFNRLLIENGVPHIVGRTP
jgi:photosystem II stability/assembly factor-like uncharacterized protein